MIVRVKSPVQRRGSTGEGKGDEGGARANRGLQGQGRRGERESQGEEGSARMRGDGEKQMRRRAGECFIDSLIKNSWLP